MLMKIVIILFLLTILYSLASALFFLIRDRGHGDRTVKRLTWRISLSLVLFILLWAAYHLGWIKPNGSGPIHVPETVQGR